MLGLTCGLTSFLGAFFITLPSLFIPAISEDSGSSLSISLTIGLRKLPFGILFLQFGLEILGFRRL